MNSVYPKTALISVSDKTGIETLAHKLIESGIQILSTGGTARHLEKHGIAVTPIESLTTYPEMMDGRVKTLQPTIHAGILGDREKHTTEAQDHDIQWIDLVICNLYPFESIAQKTTDFNQRIENIDIGGPAMLRAAAKNCRWVTVLCDPDDYSRLIEKLDAETGIDFEFRSELAHKVFNHTGFYDSLIAQSFSKKSQTLPKTLTLPLRQHQQLRYGENPHQEAYLYRHPLKKPVLTGNQKQGKPLSYNNLVDAQAALNAVREFQEPACVIVKHANACGIAEANTIEQAFNDAWYGDPQAAFGGIVALNRPCNNAIAEALQSKFVEVVIAPGFEENALQQLSNKTQLRLLEVPEAVFNTRDPWRYRFIDDGLLIQQVNTHQLESDQLKYVTQRPSNISEARIQFAWKALKHLHSNAIVIAKDRQTVGIGAGCVARIDAVKLALSKANQPLKGAVLASDGFFPFRDAIDTIAGTGIEMVIQPGGSKRDQEVIEACREHGIDMVLTGVRCFDH